MGCVSSIPAANSGESGREKRKEVKEDYSEMMKESASKCGRQPQHLDAAPISCLLMHHPLQHCKHCSRLGLSSGGAVLGVGDR